MPVPFFRMIRGMRLHWWILAGILAGALAGTLFNARYYPEIAEQARTLVHVSNLYLNDVQPRLAARLDLLLTSATGVPGRVFFANSGAEANECAIKLARRHGQLHGGPERYHVLSAFNSFHARTLTTLAATGQPHRR